MALDPTFFPRGLLIGFSIAAPVGPIGVLCIRRTLAGGRIVGLLSGLGAATADAFYGFVAGFGLTAVSSLMVHQRSWLRLIGGVFLLYLGARTVRASSTQQAAAPEGRGLAGAYLSTLALTITNPLTILSFAAVFAGLGLAQGGREYGSALLLVVGVFCGSALWWLLLSGGVSLLHGRITSGMMLWINRLSGSIIILFGILALASLRP